MMSSLALQSVIFLRTMHKDVLDKTRQDMLPALSVLKDDFYLAGGTGLALQIGHRRSVDFDFFCPESFDTEALFNTITKKFSGRSVTRIDQSQDTLHVSIDGVQMSFFGYDYPLIDDLIETENLYLASVLDIACMKLSAVIGRATIKDYVDIYYILQDYSLEDLLHFADDKYPNFNRNLVLKSLVYFDDVTEKPLKFLDCDAPGFSEVKEYLRKTVKNYE